MTTQAPPAPAAPRRLDGTVVEVHGMLVTVEADDGERLRARPPRNRVTPVIGDRCTVEVEGREARVVELAPRACTFERLGRPRQIIATHIDRLVIVGAVDPGPRPGLIDRMWCALDDPRVEVVLVMNKCDLEGADEAVAAYADHLAAGARIVRTSTRTGEGLDTLRGLLSGGLSLLAGHSGVGKSSLVNALVPDARLLTGDVNAQTSKGRHTTTVATCHRLGDGRLVDTPGVRAFALDALPHHDLARRFPGFHGLADRCHFGRCLHEQEPGCAVRDDSPPERLVRWDALLLALREEADASREKGPPPRSRRKP
jgi:ribosome biogenesis GTPase